VTPGGTITSTVFDARGLAVKVFVGTDDTGATEEDPTGGGATGNNMVLVTQHEYDGGADGGDGLVTATTQYASATDTRVTEYGYDWRNRLTETDGEVDYFERRHYDNLDRVVRTERYATSAADNLIGRLETLYDDLGRVYCTVRYGVDPTNGDVGESLVDDTWYDTAGNVIKSQPSGAELFTKTACDSLNRPIVRYVSYDTTEDTHAEALSVEGDTVLEQTETAYDPAGNVLQTTHRQRYHNATGSGPLDDPSSQPKARVTYVASYPDALGRVVAVANYGTNGGDDLERSDTVPARSDTILVTSTVYDAAGMVESVTDPAGMVVRTEYDDAGRRVRVIENYQEASSSSSSSSGSSGSEEGCPASNDVNRTTEFAYTPDGALATLTAVNSETGDQVTTYTYGTTLSDSAVATSTLLRKVAYPDSTGDGDTVKYACNRLGQQTTVTDQRGCVHTFDYDKLGRLVHDRVTTVGTGVDGAVRRISTTYEVRGLVEKITSYDNAAVGSGNVVNEVRRQYNDFGQVTTSFQEHGGAVNTSTSPNSPLNNA
jgi:YD repeat-containing protein